MIKLATYQQAQLRFVHVMENASVFWHDEIYIDAVILQQIALREAGKNILDKAQTLAMPAANLAYGSAHILASRQMITRKESLRMVSINPVH